MSKLTITVCGHRPKRLYGYQDKKRYIKLMGIISELLRQEEEQTHHQYPIAETTVVRTGGAQGADQLAFWAAKDLGIATEVFVPFPGQESRWSEHGLFSQAAYRKMLQCADDVFITHKHKEHAAAQLIERDHIMLEGADRYGPTNILIAVWDGIESGGTYQTIAKALMTDIPKIIIVDPVTMKADIIKDKVPEW